jgi:hypothetical protein
MEGHMTPETAKQLLEEQRQRQFSQANVERLAADIKEAQMTRYTFNDAVEASAFTVAMCQMVGKEYLDGIESSEDGKYTVVLTKPLPSPWDQALPMAIKHDQETNPEKWARARADLEKSKQQNEPNQ